MKKNIVLLLLFMVLISCDNKQAIINIEGIYHVSFIGTYNDFNADTLKKWEKNQLMKISKINDSLYNLILFDGYSAIDSTSTSLLLSSSILLQGNFYFQERTSSYRKGNLYGQYHVQNNIISGFFSTDTIIIKKSIYYDSVAINIPISGNFFMYK